MSQNAKNVKDITGMQILVSNAVELTPSIAASYVLDFTSRIANANHAII